MNKNDIHEGQRVHYAPEFGRKENGIVKEITEHAVFVVYKCDGDWNNYKKYTGANTSSADIYPGWITENEYVKH